MLAFNIGNSDIQYKQSYSNVTFAMQWPQQLYLCHHKVKLSIHRWTRCVVSQKVHTWYSSLKWGETYKQKFALILGLLRAYYPSWTKINFGYSIFPSCKLSHLIPNSFVTEEILSRPHWMLFQIICLFSFRSII